MWLNTNVEYEKEGRAHDQIVLLHLWTSTTKAYVFDILFYHYIIKLKPPSTLSYIQVTSLLCLVGFQMPLVSLSLILESFLAGCGRFTYLACSSVVSSVLCSTLMLYLAKSPNASVVTVWWCISGFFMLRLALASFMIFHPTRGPLVSQEQAPPKEEEILEKSNLAIEPW